MRFQFPVALSQRESVMDVSTAEQSILSPALSDTAVFVPSVAPLLSFSRMIRKPTLGPQMQRYPRDEVVPMFVQRSRISMRLLGRLVTVAYASWSAGSKAWYAHDA